MSVIRFHPHPAIVAQQRRFRAITGAVALGVTLVAFFYAASAWAQEAATGVLTAGDATLITGAAKDGKWLLAMAAVLVVVMRFVRGPLVGLLPEGKIKAALSSTVGGWLTNVLGSVVASLVTALVAGTALDVVMVVNLVLGAVLTSFAAAGGHELLKDVAAKGAAAAAAVDSKAEALKQLPPP